MTDTKIIKTPVAMLQELAVKQNIELPQYKQILTTSDTQKNYFETMVTVAGIETKGIGLKKQISKQCAAYNALQKLAEQGLYNPEENPVENYSIPIQTANDNVDMKSTNYVGDLEEKCAKRGLPSPVFVEVLNEGPPHAKKFAYECRVGNNIKTGKDYPTKKLAKQMAAYELINIVEKIEIKRRNNGQTPVDKITQAAIDYIKTMDVVDKTNQRVDIKIRLGVLMKQNNLKYDDFKKDFENVNEESLKNVTSRLGVEYKLQQLQEEPCIVELTLLLGETLTAMGTGDNYDTAKLRAIEQCFMLLKAFIANQV